MEASLDIVYRPSDDVVARDIEGELIIIPITSGVGDLEDELLTLNETGRAIWERLDGRRTLQQVMDELQQDYEEKGEEVQTDVAGFVNELLKRGLVNAC